MKYVLFLSVRPFTFLFFLPHVLFGKLFYIDFFFFFFLFLLCKTRTYTSFQTVSEVLMTRHLKHGFMLIIYVTHIFKMHELFDFKVSEWHIVSCSSGALIKI